MNQAVREFDEEEDFFRMPNLSETFSKGVEAIRGRKPEPTPRQRSSSRVESDTWEDWDDDDW
ncbi:MAG: hypothetical protein HC925_04165 [Coleofasciculaceae cyanobacterium SM2_3_26]|nr:hypothetical protein [Coleofasciculaceae cyanobacterium SM2_3_26]